MGHGCIGKFMHRSLVFGICAIGAGVALPVFAASNTFDGSYSGEGTVTFGTAPVCGADGPASVAVKDGEIVYGFGEFPLKMQVAPNGTFSDKIRKGNRGGGQTMRVKGKISNSGLEARFVVNGLHGHVCSYHWTLRKA
jgi:hypothetical protein